MTLISNLLVTAIVVLALTFVCIAWGRTTYKFLGFDQGKNFDFNELWLGFSMLLASIEFLHLIVPIDWKISLVVFVSSLWTIVNRAERTRWLRNLQTCKNLSNLHFYEILMITGIAIFWCLRAMGEPTNFDSGLYHFGSIRWMNEQPIVPGLANLHWRLALNQSYFGFLALVNVFPLWDKGYAVGGLFLAYMTALTTLRIAKEQTVAWRWIFGGLVFMYLGYLAGMLSNPTPDTVIGLLEIVVFCLLFRIVQNNNQKDDSEINGIQNLRDLTLVLILSLSLITTKLSSVAFAVSSMAVVIYIQLNIWRAKQTKSKNEYLIYFKLLTLMTGISAVHILRGYLLSGAPFFPNTFAGAWGLDWAFLKEFAEFEANFIYSWARQPGVLQPEIVLNHSNWISQWIKSFSVFAVSWFGIATTLMLVNFVLSFSQNANRLDRRYLALYLPIIVAFVFWFLTAPDVRFLGAIPVLFLSLSIWYFYTFILISYKQVFGFVYLNKKIYGVLAVATISLISFKLTGVRSLSFDGWTPIPEHALIVEKTLSDLPINVPTKNGQCWDAPLPCASVFNGNLHADPIKMPWPLTILNIKRYFYSVKFLNLKQ